MSATPETYRIRTASRLHFGLLSFGQTERRQFGGVGLMVQRPGLELSAAPAAEFSVEEGPAAERIWAFARQWRGATRVGDWPAYRLRVLSAPPEHVGLGTGTQLGLAVAAMLFRLTAGQQPDAAVLARSVGRGQRSSVGTYGFDRGGLIFEWGKWPAQPLGEFGAHEALPSAWRVVQICPRSQPGLSGAEERLAFGQLPPIPLAVSDRLERCVQEEMLPAARRGALDEFGESVYQYGWAAGLCFSACQGGPFASPRLADYVQRLRARGIRGVGQSSWGPTLFALVTDTAAADELVTWFRQDVLRHESQPVDLRVSPIAERGAVVEPV